MDKSFGVFLQGHHDRFTAARTNPLSRRATVTGNFQEAGAIDDGSQGSRNVGIPPDDRARMMISDPDRPGRMGETARKITDRFGLESVMFQWEDLLTRVTAG